MNKFWIIFKREYLSRVKTKGFIIGTVLTPLFILLMTIGPGLLMSLKSDNTKKIAVIDLSNIVYDEIVKTLADTTKSGKRIYEFSKVSVKSESIDSVKANLSRQVDQDKISSYLVFPNDVVESNQTEFYSKNLNDFDEQRAFRDAISQIITNYRLKQSKLDPEFINKITKRIDLKTYKVTKGGEQKQDIGLSYITTMIMVVFLYMAMIMYGAFVMRSVYEEKSARVVEVVLSSCKPFQLLAGKVLGIGAVGLTQYLIWAIAFGLLTLYSSAIFQIFSANTSGITIPTIPISVLFYFVLFFFIGYILYATLYAALGAMVNSDQEAQQLQMPVIMIIIFAMLMAFSVMKNPMSDLSRIVSLIPLFTPITMFARIATQMPPFWEILLSIFLSVLLIALLIWLAAKIFRVGILMYGKRPTLPELIKWLTY
jgi:ABC-2 type transport system permease protein